MARLVFCLTILLIAVAGPVVAETGDGPYLPDTSVYIPMADGVRIAADVYLPSAVQESERVPALVTFTRYWRARVRHNMGIFAHALKKGYAVVVVDVRGSGASFGSRKAEVSTCETRDFSAVIDWIASRQWSNGKVASIGNSYSGDTAENASYSPSAALTATIPRFTDFDLYTSVLFPGGVRNKINTDDWGYFVETLDNNKNITVQGHRIRNEPVSRDKDGSMLEAAIKEHAANIDITATFKAIEFSDDLLLAKSLQEDCHSWVTAHSFKSSVERNQIPSLHWGSWMDAGTASGVIARFASYEVQNHQYIIGPWSHGGGLDADPYNPEHSSLKDSMEVVDQYQRIFDFLEAHLGNKGGSEASEKVLWYYTMGEKRWKKTTTWPPAGHREMVMSLNSERKLIRGNTVQGKQVPDIYKIDFGVGTGAKTRWSTQNGGGDIFYGDRADIDKRLLTYDSAPLEKDLEITGFPLVHLYFDSTHPDGVFIAYLESVAPDGSVFMITEGSLRLIHRKISEEVPPFPQFGPYHSFKRKDATAIEMGAVNYAAITLLPTSIRVPAGHKLRVAIAGHDKDSFYRFPEVGEPTVKIYHDTSNPSRIVLPVTE